MLTSLAIAAAIIAPPTPAPTFKIVSTKIIEGLRPLAFAAAPTGHKVAMTLENRTTRVVDAVSRVTTMTLDPHPLPPRAIAWSPDGKYLATGDESARVMIWDARFGKLLKTLRDHQRGIQALAFSPKSNVLASTGHDDAIIMTGIPTYKRIGIGYGKGINLYSGTYMPSGGVLVGTLGKGVVILSPTGTVAYGLGGHPGEGALGCWPNKQGTLAISAGRDGMASIWDLKKRTKINSLKGHSDWVVQAGFAPNGAFAVTSSTDGTVRFWNYKNYKQIGILENQARDGSPFAFTSDGKYLFTVTDQGFLQITGLQ